MSYNTQQTMSTNTQQVKASKKMLMVSSAEFNIDNIVLGKPNEYAYKSGRTGLVSYFGYEYNKGTEYEKNGKLYLITREMLITHDRYLNIRPILYQKRKIYFQN